MSSTMTTATAWLYTLAGGTSDVCLNGAAARLVQLGDKVIIITYGDYDESELASCQPQVVHVDAANRPVPVAAAQQLGAEPGPVLYEEYEPAGK